MKMNMVDNFVSGVLKSILLNFQKKEEPDVEMIPAKRITKELDQLWEMRRKKEEGLCTEAECKESISQSFQAMQDLFSKEDLNSNHFWPRYVMLSIHTVEEAPLALLQYIREDNYIVLTKRLSDISASVYRGGEDKAKKNMENFAIALYKHILQEINALDHPSCLALGRIFQKRGEYEIAKFYFEKIIETDKPFYGITSILVCFGEEIKAIQSEEKKRSSSMSELKEKTKSIEEKQYEIYEKWSDIMEERIQNSPEVSDKYKKDYVALLTGYARFERNRRNYSKAFMLLKKVPENFPDIYRVYTEEAMIYQFKSYSNPFYNIEKAIETFKKAELSMNECEARNALTTKNKKYILMPLANSYFLSGRYEEADAVCEQVLQLDNKEQRAIALKTKIASQMAFYEDYAM
jgi:hypothetical protein